MKGIKGMLNTESLFSRMTQGLIFRLSDPEGIGSSTQSRLALESFLEAHLQE
jgi:hypothetical protein